MKKYSFAILSSFIFLSSLAQDKTPIRFYKNAKVGYKDESGKVIVEPTYQAGSDFYNGYALVLKNNKRGFINNTSNVVIDFIYDDASVFTQLGFARVTQGGKSGYINKAGKVIIPLEFDFADDFNKDGLARVSKNSKFGYINPKGVEVIKLQYENAHNFTEEVAAVQNADKKWGYINSKNVYTIAATFDEAAPFYNGLARVRKDNKAYYIDLKGNWVKDEKKPEEEEMEKLERKH
ncbi:MAG: WG repeat-containing protein [Bacteroidetes bacterium]|nr:WG repeat-containing protein [Bacteroidota bacterium]